MSKQETMASKETRELYAIGIDVGIVSGFAVFDRGEKRLIQVTSLKLFMLLERIRAWANNNEIRVYIENPNTYRRFKGNEKQNSAKMAGSGAVKQTYKHIVELLEYDKIPFTPVSVIGTLKKLDAETFAKYTKWEGKTNEHGRDAAMIVFNR